MAKLAGCMRLAAARSGQATASGVKTYTYDAHGRLTDSSSTGTVNNGMARVVVYDPADNRQSYTVTGALTKIVVVPLNGFTVIPISN